MNKYNIVNDEIELRKFIEWLPSIDNTKFYYLTLLCRKKYGGPADLVLSSHICSKENITSRLKQMEIPLGTYTCKEGEIKQEHLVACIKPNPRCFRKLNYYLQLQLTENFNSNKNFHFIKRDLYSLAQNKKTRDKYFVDFDVDIDSLDPLKTDPLWQQMHTFVNLSAVTIVNTKGGYHILVMLDKVLPKFKNTFYQEISKYADAVGDQLIPIPGTTHGGFVPIANYLGNE